MQKKLKQLLSSSQVPAIIDLPQKIITMTHCPLRKVPPSSLGVGLQLAKLEKLLCKTIPENCSDKELRRYARTHFWGLSKQRRVLTRAETLEIISLLTSAMLTLRTLSPTLIADIHSTIGLLYQTQKNMKQAISSFTKALWVQAKNKGAASQVDIALSIHRTGLCHSGLGNHDIAIVLLKKALKLYENSSLKAKHPYVMHAREELKQVEEMQRLAVRARTWCKANKRTATKPATFSTKCNAIIQQLFGTILQTTVSPKNNKHMPCTSGSSHHRRLSRSECAISGEEPYSSSHARAA